MLPDAGFTRDKPVSLAMSVLQEYLPDNGICPKPTVSSVKNYLVCFSSIGCIEHPVWRGHHEEAKRGLTCEHRITRNEGAMVPLCSHVRPQGWLPSLRGAGVVQPLGVSRSDLPDRYRTDATG